MQNELIKYLKINQIEKNLKQAFFESTKTSYEYTSNMDLVREKMTTEFFMNKFNERNYRYNKYILKHEYVKKIPKPKELYIDSVSIEKFIEEHEKLKKDLKYYKFIEDWMMKIDKRI